MAPLTRSRSEQPGGIPGDMMVQYYSDRASDGGLIISEATNISPAARGWYGTPGIYTDQQIEGWQKIVKAVHAKGGRMFSQLWHTGRSSHADNHDGNTPVSASVDPSYWEDPNHLVSSPGGWVQPSPHRALDISEIPGIVEEYHKAAACAKAAGFDGVELHAANGYLLDQFLQNGSNRRTDACGGSIETARVSYWKSWKRSHLSGEAAASPSESRPPAPGTTCAIAIPQLYLPTSHSN